MILCAAGDIHGAIDRLYEDVLAFEVHLGVTFHHVFHVGDFGVWPDPARLDRATRNHDGAGDFPTYFAEKRRVPRPTTFIKGNHEDFGWLEDLDGSEALPGLRYLPNGYAANVDGVVVAGVGGCFGPSDYERPAHTLQGYARRHYTRDEVERVAGQVDVLLLHDAPAGIEFVKRFPSGDERRYVSDADGLAGLVRRVRPRLCFFGHHHYRIRTHVDEVPCIGLNAVGRPGNLVSFELTGTDARIVGEWPRAVT